MEDAADHAAPSGAEAAEGPGAPVAPEDPPTNATVELSVAELNAGQISVPREELRSYLPGLEPERRVTDWGRSERMEHLVDRTVYEFLYHYWFRVEAQGVENVPRDGPAVLVANHSGVVPPDAVMIAKAIREEHRQPRPVHFVTEWPLGGVPGLGMLAVKVGGVPNHPANLHRLLFDEDQLVLVFPEGRAGATKAIKDRYRLRRFGDGAFVRAAMRARAPIVPLAVVGAEEALPVLARVPLLGRLTRLPDIPLTPAIPLPAKFKIRFLEPVQTDSLGEAPWADRALVQAITHDIRALIQENLLEMVAERRSVWLG